MPLIKKELTVKNGQGLHARPAALFVQIANKFDSRITVRHDGGISRWSGLLDIAIDGGFVVKPSNGWYSKVDEDGVIEDKKYRIKEADTADFWIPILKSKKFQDFVQGKYQIAAGDIMQGGSENIFDDVVTMNGVEDD